MHRALLGLAALSAIITVSAPAVARHRGFVGNPRTQAGQFATPSVIGRDLCRDSRRGRRGRSSDFCRSDVAMDWYGGEWALYNNRSWAPDSYNDWWHDRPDRAYPAWMRRNQDCQRPWYSGDVLTC
jgi:hypothetical protein